LTNPDNFLRYFVFRTMDGRHLKLIAPEVLAQEIVMCSYAHLHIERHKKDRANCLSFIRSVETGRIDSDESQRLDIQFDYQAIVRNSWTHQTNLGKPRMVYRRRR
jgi:hypothetical protein